MTFNEAIQIHLDHYYRMIRSVINLNKRLKAIEERCGNCPYRRAEEKQDKLVEIMHEINQLSDEELAENHRRAFGEGLVELLEKEKARKIKATQKNIRRVRGVCGHMNPMNVDQIIKEDLTP